MANRPRAQSKYQSRTNVLVVILLLAALGIAGVTVWLLTPSDNLPQTQIADEDLSVVQQGALPGLEVERNPDHDREEFHYLLNGTPTFDKKGEGGNVCLENSAGNVGYMQVEYYLEGGEKVYTSPLLPPNWCLQADNLDKPLEKGEHTAAAIVTVYTSADADEEIGYFEEKIKIVIG